MAIKYFKANTPAQEKCEHKNLELVSAQLIQEKPKMLASVNYKCKDCGLKVQTDGTEKVDNLVEIKKIATPNPIG